MTSSCTSYTHLNYVAKPPLPENHSNTQMSGTGDMGLRVESMAAKNALEHIVGQDSVVRQDPQLLSALESLRGILYRSQHDVVGQPEESTASSSLAESALQTPSPGWEQVRPLLERAESPFATCFGFIYILTDLVHRCQARDVLFVVTRVI
jgi:hypothetical protein